MFLQQLTLILPKTTSPSMALFNSRPNASEFWQSFTNRLKFPTNIDSNFFVVLNIDSRLTYLDNVVLYAESLGGYDVLRQQYVTFEDVAKLANCVVDVGFLENGVLRHGEFIKALLANGSAIDMGSLDFIRPEQLVLHERIYAHYVSIAMHSPKALADINAFCSLGAFLVPFKFVDYELDRYTPLGYAVALNFHGYVHAASANGIDFSDAKCLDSNNLTHLAVLHSDTSMLRLVLASGSPVNCLTERGYTPLEIAVQNKRSEHLDCLLSANADPNYGLDTNTHIFQHSVALNELDPWTYTRLRKAGTRFDVMNRRRATPLHINASRFRRDTFVLMARDGLSPNAEDVNGETPFDRLRGDVSPEVFEKVFIACSA